MQAEIDSCLDEIEICLELMSKTNASEEEKSLSRNWMLKQKAILKELGFDGKMPRKKREQRQREAVEA